MLIEVTLCGLALALVYVTGYKAKYNIHIYGCIWLLPFNLPVHNILLDIFYPTQITLLPIGGVVVNMQEARFYSVIQWVRGAVIC